MTTETEAVLDAAELTLDQVETYLDVVEGVSRFKAFISSHKVHLGLAVAISASAGTVAGWHYAKKKMFEDVQATIDLEVQEAKNFYASLYQNETKSSTDPSALVKELHPDEVVPISDLEEKAERARHNYAGDFRPSDSKHDPDVEGEDALERAADIPIVEETTTVVENIFDQERIEIPGEGWDYETELARRSGEQPYIITYEEYFNSEHDWPQQVLTYYDGDDVLTDEGDQRVDEIESTVGYDNLARFGSGSNDPNIVYIRNERMEIDVEVHKSTGSYAEEVLGVPRATLEHSQARPKIRKMRRDDG